MRYGVDDDGRYEPPCPVAVRIAAILWIGFGALGIIGGVVQLAQAGAQAGNDQSRGGSCCGFVIAIAFVVVGFQTWTGQAKDTLGNGIGSILIGLLYLGVTALLFTAGVRANLGGGVKLIAAFVGLVGMSLILAGVLALGGRDQYRRWRAESGIATPPRRRRRRDDDDEEGERPRRRRRRDDDEDDEDNRPRRRAQAEVVEDDEDDRPRRRRRRDDDEEDEDDRPRRRRRRDDDD